jgi:hypothetical protein
MLSDEEKPSITLFYSTHLEKFKNEIASLNYTEIKFIVHDKNQSKIFMYITSLLSGKNKFTFDIIRDHDLDVLFPVIDYPVKSKNTKTRQIAWIPDFQHLFYPQ